MSHKFRFPYLYVGLALMVVFALALFVVSGAGAAVVQGGGLKLWQVKEPTNVAALSLRTPPARTVENWLVQEGVLSLDATEAEVTAAVSAWYQKFHKENYTGPDPVAFRKLMAREKALLSGDVQAAEDQLPTPAKNPLYVKVEFGGTDEITHLVPSDTGPGCVEVTETFGPTGYGEVPAPGPMDNASFWMPDFESHYESVLYGEGPDAPGYGVFDHPVLGEVDLTGLTLQNFLLEMSGGAARMGGGVLPMKITVAHSHEYYGLWTYQEDADGNCVDAAHDARRVEFRVDASEALKAQAVGTDWSQYDADGDHVVDVVVYIHAGEDNASSSCDNCLWSHSWGFGGDGFQLAGEDTPDDPSDDYFIQGYNVDPETLDLGVIVEEYEHQWGLPDIYVSDGYAVSAEWWCSPHTGGVYGGPLAGTKPAGHCLWQDVMLGWRTPRVINYDDPALEMIVGRPRQQPEGAEDGLIINLPPDIKKVDNEAGEGAGWWSDMGDDLDNRVYRNFDLTAAVAPVVFSFDSVWDIEEDYDYGYIEVSNDGGATWTTLPDMDGIFTDADPNNENLGWGLTGASDEVTTLGFDLSAYAGQTIGLRFRYVTDGGVANPAWWVDNLALEDANGVLYENDLDDDFSDWTSEGWVVTPFDQKFEKYYLVEWRDANGLFDSALKDPYQTVYSDSDEWVIDHLPFNTPGLVVMLRDTRQAFDYEISSNLSAGPSFGAKHALLTVESNFFPKRFDTRFASVSGGFVGPNLSGRVLPGDGAFGIEPGNAWTTRLGYDYRIAQYVWPPLETKTWAPDAPVPAFHDAWGYQPGYFYPGSGSRVYSNDTDASAVVPATANYTTRITWPTGAPFTQLYGATLGSLVLGSGNPGDDWVQYGVHVEVLEQSNEQATIRFWNAMHEVDLMGMVDPEVAAVGDEVEFGYWVQNTGSADSFLAFIPLPAGTTYVEGSAYGGLMPTSGNAAEVLAAQAAGSDLTAMAAPAAGEVTGLIWAYQVPTKESGPMGFKVMVEEAAAGTLLDATATLYDLGYGGEYLTPWRSVTAGTVRVAKTLTLPLVADTWVNSGDVAKNNNGFAALIARTTGVDNALLVFDRSALPQGAEVTEASLEVHVAGQSGAFGKQMTALNVEAFDPATVTYADNLNTYNPSTAVPAPNGAGHVMMDVAFQVAAWDAVGAQAAHHLGYLAVSASGPYSGRLIMDSLESLNARPAMLTVTYLP